MTQPNEAARRQLNEALYEVLERLAAYLKQQRQEGRHPGTDALRGIAIEEGDAEALIMSLANDVARSSAPNGSADDPPAEAESPSGLPDETPLQRVFRVFRMQPGERYALLLALAVELDQRFARLVAYLNDHVSRTRPTVGLVLASNGGRTVNAVALCERPAIKTGLLVLEGEGPLSAQTLRIAPEFLARLAVPEAAAGAPPVGVRLRPEGRSLDDLVLDPALGRALARWGGGLHDGPPFAPLIAAGPAGSGRATAAQAAAALTGRRLVEADWRPERADRADRLRVASREALWHGAVLLIRIADVAREPEWSELWSQLSDWQLPVVMTVPAGPLPPSGAGATVEPAVVTLADLSIRQRETLWQTLLSWPGAGAPVELSDAERRELAARYEFPPAMLARAIRRAVADRRLDGAAPLDFAALSQACRSLGSANMGPIAQRLPQPYSRDDLVLPPELMAELDLAAAWMRNRRRVFEQWGFGRRIALGQGLTALFAGEPGTGKTMAAQVLARELGLEIFRVDLSRVMSKYIGDTEKNLSQLFENARASGAILFFDEADVLFGKRTEVKDAHDRYANLEIGYLLQRMEEHTGTTVLATNRMRDLDDAFTRRFHFILDFPIPRPPERRRIWAGMLPREAEREAELDLDVLARDYEIAGGDIRNSVLSAAFMAAEEGGVIGLRHLKRGLRRELLKTGRVLDIKQRRALDGD